MTIKVIKVGAGQSENENLISMTLIRLDMGDRSAIEDGKRLIAEIDKLVRRKNLQEDKKNI